MINKKIGFLAVCSSLLAACGGNDRSIDVEPTLSCDSTEGAVFIDETCSPWQMPSAFEQDKVDWNINEEIPYGVSGELVEQQIVNADDSARGQVWDVQYGDNTQLNGIARFQAPEGTMGVDLSEYATGKLTFDLRVIELGHAEQGLLMKIACGWPCVTNDIHLPVDNLGQWQTHEVSVADLTADGLDITKVMAGLEIFPTWNEQTGAHFQVDNIRWSKGTSAAAEKCFAQHFDQNSDFLLQSPSSSEDESFAEGWISTIWPQVTITPDWEKSGPTWSFAADQGGEPLVASPCASSGVLSVDVYLAEDYIIDGNMSVGLLLKDQYGSVIRDFGSISAADLKPEAWVNIRVDLSVYTDLTDEIGYVGIYFDAGDKPVDVGGEIMLDNFLITRP